MASRGAGLNAPVTGTSWKTLPLPLIPQRDNLSSFWRQSRRVEKRQIETSPTRSRFLTYDVFGFAT